MKPADIREVHRILMEDFHANPAPIVDFIATQGRDPFKILVATLLSARTRDQTTAHVVRDQLFPVVRGFDDFPALSTPPAWPRGWTPPWVGTPRCRVRRPAPRPSTVSRHLPRRPTIATKGQAPGRFGPSGPSAR